MCTNNDMVTLMYLPETIKRMNEIVSDDNFCVMCNFRNFRGTGLGAHTCHCVDIIGGGRRSGHGYRAPVSEVSFVFAPTPLIFTYSIHIYVSDAVHKETCTCSRYARYLSIAW